jgi:hypothetical protein
MLVKIEEREEEAAARKRVNRMGEPTFVDNALKACTEGQTALN